MKKVGDDVYTSCSESESDSDETNKNTTNASAIVYSRCVSDRVVNVEDAVIQAAKDVEADGSSDESADEEGEITDSVTKPSSPKQSRQVSNRHV